MQARLRWPAWPSAFAVGLAVSLVAGLAAVLPLLRRGPSCGQDFDFHLQSWLAVRAAWHAGLWAPHWVAGANYGAGEPRFVFYPPLSWLLGAGLGVVLPWAWVPAAFMAVCFAGAAGAMQRVARDWCSPGTAALAGVMYALSPYLLFTGYERTAYAELLAAVWMPLLLGALPAARLPVGRVAMLLAALWYTNAPAGVMGCYLVLLATLWRAGFARRLADSGRELARGAGALTLGCGLAGNYLLPAWYEQRFVSIARAVGPGMRVEDSFLFEHTGEAYHDQVLRTASGIVVVTLAVGAFAVMAILWRKRDIARLPAEHGNGSAPCRAVAALALFVVLCALLQLHWSDPLWRLLPELRFLQFPWRLMLPVSAVVALLAAMAFHLWSRGETQVPGRKRYRPRRPAAPDCFTQDDPTFEDSGSNGASKRARRRFAGALAFAGAVYAAGLVTWAAQTRYQPCDDEDKVAAQLALLGSGTGFEGTDEYAAAGSDNGEIQRGLPRVRLLRSPEANEGDDSAPAAGADADNDAANPTWRPDAQARVSGEVRVERWGPERFTVRLHPDASPTPNQDTNADANQPANPGGTPEAFAVLRLERFHAWRVRLNGSACGAACMVREDGLVTVRVPAGRWSTIDARYRTTEDVWLGRAISCAAALVLGWDFWRKRRRAFTQLS